MILQCPECRANYMVPDSAISVDGRQVRCARCRHSWFQDGPELAPPPVTQPPVSPPSPAMPAAAPVPPIIVPPAIDPADDYDAFAHRPPFRPRRNVLKWRTIGSIAAGLLMLCAIGVILWTTAPGLAQQLGLAAPQEEPLRITDNPIELTQMSNGSKLFAVSGRIANVSARKQRIPDIRADLRDASGKIVYTWTITPQSRSLGPGEALNFNSAQVDVPANARKMELHFVDGVI